MPRAAHNLVQDIAFECNLLILYRPGCYRCLPYLLGDNARDARRVRVFLAIVVSIVRHFPYCSRHRLEQSGSR